MGDESIKPALELEVIMISFKTHYYFLVFLVLFLFVFTLCQKETPSQDKVVVEEKRIDTISIWDGVALRAQPKRTGKWLASISLGERVFWLGESQVDSTNDQYEYLKVELSDGTVGWASKYVVVVDSQAGAVKKETPVYKRPDPLTMSDKMFEVMDMVAITDEKDGWVEVVGEKREKSGWIRSDYITKDKGDVTVAILAMKALREKDDIPLYQKIHEIIEKTAYPESIFIPILRQMMNEE